MQIVRPLGSGAQGSVYLGESDGHLAALKYVNVHGLDGRQIAFVRREVYNQYKLNNHSHIIQLNNVWYHEQAGEKFLVLQLEYASGGTLLNHLKSRGTMNEKTAKYFFIQIALAVHYSHSKSIYNRDIKLENILLADGNGSHDPVAKICDFGLSKDEEFQSQMRTRVGTVHYFAPELVNWHPDLRYDGAKVDVWTLGVVLFTLLTSRYPFLRAEDLGQDSGGARLEATQAVLDRIQSGDWSFPMDTAISDKAKDLVRRMLSMGKDAQVLLQTMIASVRFTLVGFHASCMHADPETRPTAEEILRHPWCTAASWSEEYIERMLKYNEARLCDSGSEDGIAEVSVRCH